MSPPIAAPAVIPIPTRAVTRVGRGPPTAPCPHPCGAPWGHKGGFTPRLGGRRHLRTHGVTPGPGRRKNLATPAPGVGVGLGFDTAPRFSAAPGALVGCGAAGKNPKLTPNLVPSTVPPCCPPRGTGSVPPWPCAPVPRPQRVLHSCPCPTLQPPPPGCLLPSPKPSSCSPDPPLSWKAAVNPSGLVESSGNIPVRPSLLRAPRAPQLHPSPALHHPKGHGDAQ